jgi:putative redox protein
VSVRVTARRLTGFAHEIEIDGGHTLVVDEPADAGGTDTGPSPGRLLAASLAACTAVTMEMYAERKGWEIGPVEVEVDADHDEGTHIARSYKLTVKLPDGLDEEQRQRLFKVAAKCPVHKVLSGEARIEIGDSLAPGGA